jgi:putative transposase
LSEKEISEGKTPSVSTLCDFLGISRQGYYQHTAKEAEVDILRSSIVLYCQEMRAEKLPHAGMRELYELCCRHFSEKMVIGRDQCFEVFRSNGLVLRQKRRPRTTDSNHNYYIYPDLLNTSPKFVALRCGQLTVVDITYVATESGWAYLSLVTDAATRMIIGYALHPSLDREGPLIALEMALDFYRGHSINISNLIHHSDRGSQYCSNEYVAVLKENGIRISMTQTGDPLHNALAERMNNTLKNGWLFDCEGDTFEMVKGKIDKAVYVYNNIRPHQALAMKTPMEAFEEARTA